MSKLLGHSKVARAEFYGWMVVIFGCIGFFVWASLYPIDEGIRTSGYVISTGRQLNVTSSIDGSINKIYKKNNDLVTTGEIVMDLHVRPIEPKDRDVANSVKLLEASNISLKNAYRSRQEQITALQSQYEGAEKLLASGFASKNFLSSIEVQLTTAKSDSYEIKARIEENENRLRDLKERIGAIRVAPASGKLNDLNLKEGGQIRVGDRIFSIAPNSNNLIVSIQIPVDFATQIQNGLLVNIIFPTLPGGTAIYVSGRLEHISNDRKVDEKTGLNYFDGIVIVENNSQLEELKIKTGLPVSAIIKAGHRTLLSYITRPFTERIIRGLR